MNPDHVRFFLSKPAFGEALPGRMIFRFRVVAKNPANRNSKQKQQTANSKQKQKQQTARSNPDTLVTEFTSDTADGARRAKRRLVRVIC